jgi:DNA-nicking Smr family endonuclease
LSRGTRKLSQEEAALWARVARTVTPIDKTARVTLDGIANPSISALRQTTPRATQAAPSRREAAAPPPVIHGLDAGWDRKLARGLVQPDFSLDLHGCTLDAAHSRLLHGLTQAKAMGARLVLLVTGRPRPADPADRTARRGAIRAKAIDWLAASEHASDIAAIRGAHPRHGGQGALYVVLRRASRRPL